MDIVDLLLMQKKNELEQYYMIIDKYEELAREARETYKTLYEVKKSKEEHPEEYKLFIENKINSYEELGEHFLSMEETIYKKICERLKANDDKKNLS